MATVDAGNRPRDSLPSITHFDLDRLTSDRGETPRFSLMNGLSISTAPLVSPTHIYSGPPPPYSAPASTAVSGYISPPESTTRRSTRDEQESPGQRKSLPSIHEALGDNTMPLPAPLSTSSQQQQQPSPQLPPPPQQQPGSTPLTAVGQSFPEPPKGPSNPFSQPPPAATAAPILRDPPFSTSTLPNGSTASDNPQPRPVFPPVSAPDPRQSVSQSFGYPGSPRTHASSSFRSNSLTNTTFSNPSDSSSAVSPRSYEPVRHQSYPFPSFVNPPPTSFPSVHEPFQFTAGGAKLDDQRLPYPRIAGNDPPYGDTVKRHLDVFDAEIGLNEIGEASSRTLEFSRIWAQRYHQGNRTAYFQDALPGLHEVDDMMRQSHRIMENLTRLREVIIAQQTALSEQRARLARGSHLEDDYRGLSDDYKGGGFAGGDSKKRRGKAAPPGRCHSCNRAETPEWRRGPDGARTLCNACGLHYAKLTRKMGVNKAAALTGSNLRPKNLDQRP